MFNGMLVGALLTSFLQLPDTGNTSSFAAIIDTPHAITLQLNVARDNKVPVLFIDGIYTDDNGIYSYNDPSEIKDAILASGYFGRIILAFDEPLWRARHSGQDPAEVIAIMDMIRSDLPTLEFAVVYSYAELYYRYVENQNDLGIWYGADHIGVDCYGPWNECGNGIGDIPALPMTTYLDGLWDFMQANGTNARMFLVPGAFKVDFIDWNEDEIVEQIEGFVSYTKENSTRISIFGVFIWGSLGDIDGAKEFPRLIDAVHWSFEEVRRIGK